MTAPGVAKRLKDLSQRGRLIVIDPRRTETAQIANQHLFIRPGTDALFLAALLQHLQRLGPARIAHYRDRLDGLDTALAAINALPLDAVSAHTGIDQTAIAGIAKALHDAPTAAVYGRMGLSTQRLDRKSTRLNSSH